MGERIHPGPEVRMLTHVYDMVAVLEFEDLQKVVVVGASYGGIAVTGAADRVSARIAMVIHVDAVVPHDGQSGRELPPETFGEEVRSSADQTGHGWCR